MNLPKNLPSPMELSKKEILDLLIKEEYGVLPSAPRSVHFHVEENASPNYCAGKAVFKKLRLICETEYGYFSFPVSYIYPTKADKPVPAFVHINFRFAAYFALFLLILSSERRADR